MDAYNTDMPDAAELAACHYCNMLDPRKHYIPYFFVKLDREESYAFHSEWDFGDATGRYLDALISARKMTGRADTAQCEERLKDALRWMFSPGDGLSYRMETNDWVKMGANMFDQRSVLLGLVSWFADTGESEPAAYIRGMIGALTRISVQRDGYMCFPFQDYVPGMEIPKAIFNEHGFVVDPAHYGGGVLILPLAVYYGMTGDPEAEAMLRKLTNFIVYHSRVFGEDGSFWSRGRYPDDGHFHSKMGTVAGILRYAILKGDESLLAWCDRVYLWARSMGASMGWFPEGTGLNNRDPVNREYEWIRGVVKHSETCCTTDMIHCALYLSKCGYRNYWDHADAYVNYLLAAQIRDVSWAGEVTGREDDDQFAYRDIPNRYRGAFTGRSQPNDLTESGALSTMACCCAAGGRGLYLLWSNAVELKDGVTRIQLFTGGEGETASVRAGIPEEGFLEITVRADTSLLVRIPAWLDADAAGAAVDGKPTGFGIADGYMDIGMVRAGSLVIVRFPLEERIVPETIAGDRYMLTWKGNRVVDIDPRGSHMPLFQYEA